MNVWTESRRVRSSVYAVVLLILCAVPALWADDADAKITWYTGGQKVVSIEPVKAELAYSLPFAGTTSYKTLVIYVQKGQSPQKSSAIPVDDNGKFNVSYLFNEGPGNYKVTIFGNPQPNSLHFSGVGYFSVHAAEAVPQNLPMPVSLNQRILNFVDSVMGQKVGTGECWDLAQQALDRNGADWVRVVQFGRQLDPAVDQVIPGDIIQFKTLKITEHLPNGATRWETLGAPDHTSVVHDVLGPLHYKLAHQNLGGKRFVQITELNLNDATSGQYWIYRPVPRLLIP